MFLIASPVLVACGSDGTADTADAAPVDGAPVDATTTAPDAGPPLFEPEPECEGASVVPFLGDHAVVISTLQIGTAEQGFDLDRDGEPDNQLANLGTFANPEITGSVEGFDLVVPLEFFDFETAAVDECVKFALYIGGYKQDADGDGAETAIEGGDCNDHDAAIFPGAAEVADNLKDDDCDGLADETEQDDGNGGTTTVPSTDTGDADEDGVTIADGDCDDENADVLGPTGAEVCGDGFDNECNGAADFAVDGDGAPVCTPFDDSADELLVNPASLDENGEALVAFKSAEVVDAGDALTLRGGPALFSVKVPLPLDGLVLDLTLTGATIEATVTESAGGITLTEGRVGGVIDARTANDIRGISVPDFNIQPEDSLLDATFANLVGTFLVLPTLPISEAGEWPDGCKTPDIDVDRDGLEGFCDSDGDNEVDLCVDGDRTVVHDEVDDSGEVTVECTEAMDDEGNYRFVDGISVELNFEAVPTILPESIDG